MDTLPRANQVRNNRIFVLQNNRDKEEGKAPLRVFLAGTAQIQRVTLLPLLRMVLLQMYRFVLAQRCPFLGSFHGAIRSLDQLVAQRKELSGRLHGAAYEQYRWEWLVFLECE